MIWMIRLRLMNNIYSLVVVENVEWRLKMLMNKLCFGDVDDDCLDFFFVLQGHSLYANVSVQLVEVVVSHLRLLLLKFLVALVLRSHS